MDLLDRVTFRCLLCRYGCRFEQIIQMCLKTQEIILDIRVFHDVVTGKGLQGLHTEKAKGYQH